MKRLLALLIMASIVMLSGCGMWSETDYERDQRLSGESDPVDPATPAFVENWFYREFGDAAVFPDLSEATDQETVLSVAAWVDTFDHENPAAFQYQTTGETVASGGGDTSSLAWLNFHTCLANGIIDVSVELVEWDDGTEEYFCAWRDGGSIYLIAADTLVVADDLLGGIGHLAYGFDDVDYWEYD